MEVCIIFLSRTDISLDPDIVSSLNPLFSLMGKNIKYMGPSGTSFSSSLSGSGQHTKMVNQITIASTMIGVVEGLVYASKAGLDQGKVIEAIAAGAAGSWSLSNYGPRILKSK